jgi:hypothetical protein
MPNFASHPGANTSDDDARPEVDAGAATAVTMND